MYVLYYFYRDYDLVDFEIVGLFNTLESLNSRKNELVENGKKYVEANIAYDEAYFKNVNENTEIQREFLRKNKDKIEKRVWEDEKKRYDYWIGSGLFPPFQIMYELGSKKTHKIPFLKTYQTIDEYVDDWQFQMAVPDNINKFNLENTPLPIPFDLDLPLGKEWREDCFEIKQMEVL